MNRPENKEQLIILLGDISRKFEVVRNMSRELDKLIAAAELVTPDELEAWGWSKEGAEDLKAQNLNRKAAWKAAKERKVIEDVPMIEEV
jgi:hypothetical protein